MDIVKHVTHTTIPHEPFFRGMDMEPYYLRPGIHVIMQQHLFGPVNPDFPIDIVPRNVMESELEREGAGEQYYGKVLRGLLRGRTELLIGYGNYSKYVPAEPFSVEIHESKFIYASLIKFFPVPNLDIAHLHFE